MNTLLKEVQNIEEEATKIVEQTRQQSMDELSKLQENESHVLEDTRKQATERAERIIQEKLREADKEINTILQQSKHAVESVHTAAKQNWDDALTLARNLFTEGYLSN